MLAACTTTPTRTAEPVSSTSPDAQAAAAEPLSAQDIRRPATDVPAPIGKRAPQKVTIELETVEAEGRLADGAGYPYWTFGGRVPGPMLRVRVGDTVEIHLKNSGKTVHSIDLHAVNGPGGGAGATQVAPGETKSFTFRALNPGLFVYHCASPPIPLHIANGMYGLILVEPEGGLPPVDYEFYVMEGEIYTQQARLTKGHIAMNYPAIAEERPTYVVFNGSYQALTADMALTAKTGEHVRIFFGNAGPQLVSSFHVIGEVFDAVHPEGATEAWHNVQTTLIPAGGAAWVEFQVTVPGRYLLVDHSIARATDKGALGHLDVEGPENPDVFSGGSGAGH
ncbi:MAG: copper-containing nitrite reductase [Actinomycetota bacterium]